MADATQDVQTEDANYEHGEELLLGGVKKLVIVSRASPLRRFQCMPSEATLTVALLLTASWRNLTRRVISD